MVHAAQTQLPGEEDPPHVTPSLSRQLLASGKRREPP